jgi:hypothetical protein
MKNIVLAKCFAGATASLLLGIALVTCGNSPPDTIGGTGSSGGGGGTTGNTTPFSLPDASSSGSSSGGSTGNAPTGDANCGSQTSSTTKQPTDVLLVLDRSGSMSESIAEDCCCARACANSTGKTVCRDTTGCTERWPALTSAVKTAIDNTPQINWGLKFFSSASGQGGDSCGVNAGADVGIDPTKPAAVAAAVQSSISGATPNGATPTTKAITYATAYLQTVKDQNSKVILLATDGEPNCKSTRDTTSSDADGTEAAIKAALTAGFKVYVVGIGPADNVTNLNRFAAAGGTDKYYPATSATDLTNALASISKAVSSCSFTIQTPAQGSDATNIAVYVGGNLVQKDPSNGWSLGADGQTIILNGSTCEAVSSGDAGEVKVLFGCSSPPQILR